MTPPLRGLTLVLLLALLPALDGRAKSSKSSAKEPDTAVTVAGLTFKPPRAWKAEAVDGRMRKGQWEVPPPKPEKDQPALAPAQVVLFYFGNGHGGTVPNNLDRWRATMKSPAGEPMVGEVAERVVDNVHITEIQLYGTYASGIPAPGIPPIPRPNYGLAGAIVEGPQGNVFIRMTGPADAVKAGLDAFRTFAGSFGKPVDEDKKKKK